MIYKYLYLKAYKNIIYILASLPAILSFDGEACCKLSRVLFAHWIPTGQEHLNKWGINLGSQTHKTIFNTVLIELVC